MTIRIREYDGGFGVVVQGTDVIDDHEFRTRLTAHLSQDIDKLRGLAWSMPDYSEASSVDAAAATLESVAALCDKAANSGVIPVVAMVGPSDVAFGLLRMFEALAVFTGWTIRSFRSRVEAVEWTRGRVGDRYCRELIESVDSRAPQVGAAVRFTRALPRRESRFPAGPSGSGQSPY